MQTKNLSTRKQLEDYSKLASALLLTAGAAVSADAAIVYTDVVPDEILIDNTFDIDMDGDGTAEFTIFQGGFGSPGGSYYSYIDYANIQWSGTGSATAIVATTSLGYWGGTYSVAKAMSVGSTINSTQSFVSGYYSFGFANMASFGNVKGYYNVNAGDFLGAVDKYLGVRFELAGATHYGWIRVDVTSTSDVVTVKDFAYEDVPGMGIAAGAGMTGSACDPTTAPTNFMATVSASSVTFNWDAVPGSVGCQLAAGPSGGGFPITQNFLGAGVTTSGPIPFSLIPSGNYQARVRCACEILPVPVATPFSNTDFFTVPAPRLANEANLEIAPNPAASQLKLRYDAVANETVHFRITNIAGQELFAQKADLSQGSHNVTFDVSEFENGLYILHIVNGDAMISERFEVIN